MSSEGINMAYIYFVHGSTTKKNEISDNCGF